MLPSRNVLLPFIRAFARFTLRSLPSKTVSGSVYIAAGETKAMETLTRAMMAVREEYPEVDGNLPGRRYLNGIASVPSHIRARGS